MGVRKGARRGSVRWGEVDEIVIVGWRLMVGLNVGS